jgi:hypothetical protein
MTSEFKPYCSVMTGHTAKGYFCPTGHCRNPVTNQYSDGRVYCEEHKNCGLEADRAFVKTQINRKAVEDLVAELNRFKMPKLPDGSLHPMEMMNQKLVQKLEKILGNT